jgi:hypothetical protein
MRSLLIVLLLLGPVARADEIYAKTGSRPIVSNVKIVEEKGGKVYYLDRSLKRRSFPKSMVGRTVERRSDVHEYLERFEAAKDADAVMALAKWAEEKRFHKDVVHSLHERALELDPDHEGANVALGRVQFMGEWMTPAEREQRIQQGKDEEMRARGLVKWKDQWVTPEDKAKLEQGLRKHDGKWMTEDEIKEAQGYVRHNGKWVKKDELAVLEIIGDAKKDTGLGDRLQLVQSEHYAVMGDLQEGQLADLGKTMERLLAEWTRLFPDTKGEVILEGKHRLFAFRKNGPYMRLVRNRYERQKATEDWSDRFAKIEERRMKLRLRETSFWEIQPHALSAHVQMPDPFEGLRAHCVHFGANILATRYGRLRFPTWWLNEGLAYYFEKKVTGGIQTYSADAGGGKYADQGPLDTNKANPWLEASKWNGLLVGLVRSNHDPQLDRMKSKDLFDPKNRLKAQDLAKALSVVTFLILDDVEKFRAFFLDCKTGGPSDPTEREVIAVLKHYGSYQKIDERWKAFALNGFRLVR